MNFSVFHSRSSSYLTFHRLAILPPRLSQSGLWARQYDQIVFDYDGLRSRLMCFICASSLRYVTVVSFVNHWKKPEVPDSKMFSFDLCGCGFLTTCFRPVARFRVLNDIKTDLPSTQVNLPLISDAESRDL